MGLDMYLRGYKYLLEDYREPANNRMEDGYRIQAVEVALGYWRKHPDLHGFIVGEFAEGEDNCQGIPLQVGDLQKCIQAVEQGALPRTDGFFFGTSAGHWLSPEGVEQTTRALHGAIRWLQDQNTEQERRSIIYQASW
jgi:hypothetical protein